MGVYNYTSLVEHLGHRFECITYGEAENVALECVNCKAVIVDFDRQEGEEKVGPSIAVDKDGFGYPTDNHNQHAWDTNDGICYMTETGDTYTRARIERLVAEHAEQYGLTVLDQALGVFNLCTWQHPETILDEDPTDCALWEEEEYEAGFQKLKKELGVSINGR